MTYLGLLFADHTADKEPKMTLRRRLRNVIRLQKFFLGSLSEGA